MTNLYKCPTRLNVNARINRLRSTTNLPLDMFECAVQHGYALLERFQEHEKEDDEVNGMDIKDYAKGYTLKWYPGLSDLSPLVVGFIDEDNDDLIAAMTDEQDRLGWDVAFDVAYWAQEDAALRAMTPAERAEREQQQQYVEAMLKAA